MPMALHIAHTEGSDHAAGHAGAAWTLDALLTVWERQRGRVYDRIDSIERAIAALADDRLDADLRAEAERAAHMLAGSLGMFGFVGASQAAHRLESGMAHPMPGQAPQLSTLLVEVREGVRGPVVLQGDRP
jgi:hypothetical protein